MKKLIASLLCVAMLLGVLAACGGNDTPDTTPSGDGTSDVAGDATVTPSGEGATVTIAKTSLPSHVDPFYYGDAVAGEIIMMNAAGLYYKDADNTIVLDLADEAVESEDGLKITYTIGEHYFYYADGSQGPQITAYDFVYGCKRAVDPLTANGDQDTYMMNAGVKNAAAIVAGEMGPDDLGVYAEDEKTLVIEFDHIVSFREDLLAALDIAPQNQEFVEKCGAEYGTSADTILNSGAWLVTEFAVGATSITLERNKNFAGYNADKSNVSTMTFVQIQDSQQAVLAYQNEDVDIVTLTGEQVLTYADDPCFTKIGTSSITYLAINCANYDNINLRRALSHSLDKTALCEQVLLDGSIPAYFIVPHNLSTDGKGNDFRDTAEEYATLDLEAAKGYWEKAKEEMGVETMELDFLITSDENAYTVGAWIQNQFQNALEGLTINLVTVPYESKMDYVMAGDFGFSVVTWGADYADPTAFLSCYVTGYPINVSKWSNAEYDQILADATSGSLTTDEVARAEALQKAEAIFMDEASIVPLYQGNRSFLVRENISGINYHLTGGNYDYRTINA